MTFHFDTLEYANSLEKAGTQRAHAEALAKGQGGALKDLVDNDLVTQAHLRAEIAKLETTLRGEMGRLKTDLLAEIRREADSLRLEFRSLKYAAAIAAFALSLIVLLSRLIK
ncbi:MAG: hypothetical protein ACKVP7_26420 [Hyphomicrobiaceae bacterium]